MRKCGRSRIAAFMACAVLLFTSSSAHPSYNSEAGRKYAVASQRLADLKKSGKKMKYRSYWIDCVRTFEVVEKKYPKSPQAAEASFARAAIYQELYQYNKHSRDLNEALRGFEKCQSSYPRHARAPEALYRVIELLLDHKKDSAAAAESYARLARAYPGSSWTTRAKTLLNPSARKKRKPEPEPRKARVAPVASNPSGAVTKIRHWSGGAYTRVVIEQNTAVRFQAQELKRPERLVFDLLNTRLDGSVDREPLVINDGILQQVRASQYAPDTVRVVLDLASIKSYAAFPLHEPERLVIDVSGEGAKGFAAEPDVHAQAPRQSPPPAKMPDVQTSGGAKLSLSSQMGLKIQTIAIDAGHGGHDPGAIGKNGLQEKTVTLDIARRLAALVKERLGCTVVMTRDKDEFIPLDQRPFIAKSHDADLFVSVHVNANRKRKARGIETYIQSLTASDREAMATAARENAMSTKKLSELKTEVEKILEALDRDNKLEDSLQLAHAVQGSLVDTMRPVVPHVVNLGVKRAFFYVLINTQMPSILAEVGFISNPEEEKLLRTDAYRQKIAEALFQGVKRFIDARSPQLAGV